MNELNHLRTSSIRLVDSIIFKLDEIGVQETLNYMTTYGGGSENIIDKSSWKYYKNIIGQKHIRNSEIRVTSIDDDTVFILDNTNILEHPLTHKLLYDKGNIYTELISNYPRDVVYINGVIYKHDYTIDDVINMEDGTIITYNTTLIEDNEYELLAEIEKYIKGFLSRWYNNQYAITDNLYLPSILTTLYSKLILEVMNIRLRNIHTYQVHSTYVDLFFRSHKRLDRYVNVLNNDSKMWLYRNLRYLSNHVGKDDTLQKIIDNLYTPNGVGVGEVKRINIENRIIKLDKDFSKHTSLIDVNFQYTRRNDTYLMLNNIVENPSDTLYKEIDTQDAKHYIPYLNKTITDIGVDIDRTKMLSIDPPHNLRIASISKINLIIDVWFKKALNDEYLISKSFTDINTGLNYKLSAKAGVYMFIKMLLGYFNKDNLVNFTYYNIPSILDKNTLLNNIWDKSRLDRYIEVVNNTIPIDKPIYKENTDVKTYVTDIQKYADDIQIYSANFNDEYGVAISKIVRSRIFKKNVIPINKRIDALLVDVGIDLYMETDTTYDYKSNLYKLLTLFTGYTIDELYNIDNDILHFKEILKNLTSYTVQIIDDVQMNNVSRIELPFNSINKIDIQPLVTISEGSIDCLYEMDARFINMWDVVPYYVKTATQLPQMSIGVINDQVLHVTNTSTTYSEITRGLTINKVSQYVNAIGYINTLLISEYNNDETYPNPPNNSIQNYIEEYNLEILYQPNERDDVLASIEEYINIAYYNIEEYGVVTQPINQQILIHPYIEEY